MAKINYALYELQRTSPRPLAKDETELINPRLTRPAFELLRTYHSAEWTDKQGRWHVIVSTARLAEIEAVERQHREKGK